MMHIFEAWFRPKMDWQGKAFRWYCLPCNKSGEWSPSVSQAQREGASHCRDKHKQEPDWKLELLDEQ